MVTVARARWILGALLCAATILNYLDRLAIGIVSVEIRHDFHLDERDYSYILSLFFFAYTVMYAGSGWILDRLGTRRGFALFTAAWSAAQMLHGFASGFVSLAACRFLLGLAEPGAWPAAAKAVQEWLPPSRRALFMGIFNAGTSFGSALAPVVVAWVTLAHGWRSAFVVTGLAGLVWLAAWLMFYQTPERATFLAPGELARHAREFVRTPAVSASARPWQVLARTRGCWSVALARFFTDPVIYFVIFWLPEYLRRERGFDLAMVRNYSWVPFVVGGAGFVAGGWLSGRLMHAGWSLPRARHAGMATGAVLMPFAMLTPFLPNAGLALAATCFLTVGHGIWVANIQTLPADLYPASEVGTVTGFTGSGGAIGGMLAQLVTGWLVTRFSYAPVFLIAGLMHPFSALLLRRALPSSFFPGQGEPAVARTLAG